MLDRARTRIGSEVWGVHYSLETDTYVPRMIGRVQRAGRDGAVVNGETIGWMTYPLEHSREEIEAWILRHPRATPGISSVVSR